MTREPWKAEDLDREDSTMRGSIDAWKRHIEADHEASVFEHRTFRGVIPPNDIRWQRVVITCTYAMSVRSRT